VAVAEITAAVAVREDSELAQDYRLLLAQLTP
jgi:hypothetical protein